MNVAWISRLTVEAMLAEADRRFPLETGGILMGYISNQDIVITDAIGPGRAAIHSRYSFTPDQDYHETEIARLYESSNRKWVYLGDWHSHPNQFRPSMSRKDIETLRRIARFRKARIVRPLMFIFGGEPDSWTPSIWQWEPGKFLRSKGKPVPLSIKSY